MNKFPFKWPQWPLYICRITWLIIAWTFSKAIECWIFIEEMNCRVASFSFSFPLHFIIRFLVVENFSPINSFILHPIHQYTMNILRMCSTHIHDIYLTYNLSTIFCYIIIFWIFQSKSTRNTVVYYVISIREWMRWIHKGMKKKITKSKPDWSSRTQKTERRNESFFFSSSLLSVTCLTRTQQKKKKNFLNGLWNGLASSGLLLHSYGWHFGSERKKKMIHKFGMIFWMKYGNEQSENHQKRNVEMTRV